MGELVVWKSGALVGGTISRLAARLSQMDVNDEIGASSVLLSPDEAAAVVAEADAALVPCSLEFALNKACVMLAVFAGAKADARAESGVARAASDLRLKGIVAALAKAPEAVVNEVVDDIVMTHRFGVPLPADVTSRVEAILKPIRAARLVAWMHQREQAKRAEARQKRAEEDARVEADRPVVEAAFAKLIGTIGEPVAVPAEKHRPKSEAQRIAATLSAVDRPAFWELVGEGVSPEIAAKTAAKTHAAE